jgi:hypothetical protein
MRHSYIVPMRWMVIYEYEVPGGALNLNSTKLPRLWSPWGFSCLRKNPHGRTGNRTWDFMIISQKLRPLDHEAGLFCILLSPTIEIAFMDQELSQYSRRMKHRVLRI